MTALNMVEAAFIVFSLSSVLAAFTYICHPREWVFRWATASIIGGTSAMLALFLG